MAVSYDIYLHAVNTSGNYNPTTPWSQRETSGGAAQTGSFDSVSGAGKDAAYSISRAASFMQNPDSIAGAGVTAVSKALPWVAAAYACVKLGTSVADNIIEFNEIEGGDYSAGVVWSNFKNGVRIMFSPFSSAIQTAKTVSQWHRENKKNQALRDLLGDSVINSQTKRGV